MREGDKRDDAVDLLAVREIAESWAPLRDARRWDDFRKLWHADGRMVTTWQQGPFENFIAASQRAFDNGLRAQHSLGETTIEVSGPRAIAQTEMTITQRAAIDGVPCEV